MPDMTHVTVRVADAPALQELLEAVAVLLAAVEETDDERYAIQVQRLAAALAEVEHGGTGSRASQPR